MENNEMIECSMCLLNEHGDTTITWDQSNEDQMLGLIQKKMDNGITFFIIEPSYVVFKKKVMITTTNQLIGKKREVVVSDNDFEELFKSGIVSTATRDQSSEIKTTGRAKTAKEVASNHTVGLRAQRGG